MANDSEHRLQYECYCWFHNKYPDLRGTLCYNLSNSRNAIEGNKNKALGLQPGRADMVFYYAGIAYMIELKTPEGKQSSEQKTWQEIMHTQGFPYRIVRSVEEFQDLINSLI